MRKKLLCVLAAVAAGLAPFAVASPSHAAPPAGEDYIWLISQATTPERCVVDREDQRVARTYTCGTWDDQFFQWRPTQQVGGQWYYNLVNYETGMCLGVDNNVTNAPVIGSNGSGYCGVWSYQWAPVWNSAMGWYQLRNRGTGRCMVARPDETTVVQYNCGNWRDQAFRWYYY